LFWKNSLFVFIYELCQGLNKSLFPKYCKEKAFVATHFLPHFLKKNCEKKTTNRIKQQKAQKI